MSERARKAIEISSGLVAVSTVYVLVSGFVVFLNGFSVGAGVSGSLPPLLFYGWFALGVPLFLIDVAVASLAVTWMVAR
jgi:hypothetical protein